MCHVNEERSQSSIRIETDEENQRIIQKSERDQASSEQTQLKSETSDSRSGLTRGGIVIK